MSLVQACGLPNVFATQNALPLMNDFCLCPAGMKALKDIQVPLVVKIQPGEIYTEMRSLLKTDFNNSLLQRAEIAISEVIKSRSHRLNSLAFEIFNVLNVDEAQCIRSEAQAGQLDFFDYANKMALHQHQSALKASEFQNSCPDLLQDICPDVEYTRREFVYAPTKDEVLWKKEADCHLTSHKEEWLKDFKKSYCSKNPYDLFSCAMAEKDFCLTPEFKALPKETREVFLKARACALYDKASERIKILVKPDIENFCPEVVGKEDHSILFEAVAATIGILIVSCWL